MNKFLPATRNLKDTIVQASAGACGTLVGGTVMRHYGIFEVHNEVHNHAREVYYFTQAHHPVTSADVRCQLRVHYVC